MNQILEQLMSEDKNFLEKLAEILSQITSGETKLTEKFTEIAGEIAQGNHDTKEVLAKMSKGGNNLDFGFLFDIFKKVSTGLVALKPIKFMFNQAIHVVQIITATTVKSFGLLGWVKTVTVTTFGFLKAGAVKSLGVIGWSKKLTLTSFPKSGCC